MPFGSVCGTRFGMRETDDRTERRECFSSTLANAYHVAHLATGEAEEQYMDAAKQEGGGKGGKVRAEGADIGAAPPNR